MQPRFDTLEEITPHHALRCWHKETGLWIRPVIFEGYQVKAWRSAHDTRCLDDALVHLRHRVGLVPASMRLCDAPFMGRTTVLL